MWLLQMARFVLIFLLTQMLQKKLKKVAQGIDKHESIVYIGTTIIKSDHLFF